MSRIDRKTAERMRAAFSIEMSDSADEKHAASMGDALSAARLGHTGRRSTLWRVRVPALVAATMMVLPIGAAVASEGAVPGDLLYPVKLMVEPLRSVVDSDVVAHHRIAELERLMDQPAGNDRVDVAVSDARSAIDELPADHRLRDEFDRLTDRVADRDILAVPPSDVVVTDHRPSDAPTDHQDPATPDETGDTTHETDVAVDPVTDETTSTTEHPTTTTTAIHRVETTTSTTTDETTSTADTPPTDR